MVKPWHVFAFSMVLLALVLSGAIIGSIQFEGSDSIKEDLTPAEPASIIQSPGFVYEVNLVQS